MNQRVEAKPWGGVKKPRRGSEIWPRVRVREQRGHNIMGNG